MSAHMSGATVSPPQVFQALSDPTRLRITALLAAAGERACVCELCDALTERQYNVSRHLKVLVQVGLLAHGRDGRWVYYQRRPLPRPFGTHLGKVLRALPDPDGRLAADRRRFDARLRLRKDGRCCVWRPAASVA